MSNENLLFDEKMLEESNNPFMFQPTLVDLLNARADELKDKPLYTYLPKPPSLESQTLSFMDLKLKAENLATLLLKTHKPGERALLVYDCNLDYIVGFFACLYAGIIAVPVYPPTSPQHLTRLMAVINDSEPSLSLTTKALRGLCPTSVDCIVNEDAEQLMNEKFQGPTIAGDQIAFLQYTSGSTGNPKGVMLTHENLMANLRMIVRGFDLRKDDIPLSWLPLYHDMGLIGAILSPLAMGIRTYLVSPMTIVRPLKWLKLISDLKITGTGAPNFAYELSCERVTDEEARSLDLSSLRVLFNGAEPVRTSTLSRFAEKFAVSGLNPKVLTPCYGMAEATLLVSIVKPGVGYSSQVFGPEKKRIVSCGKVTPGIFVRIIDENDKIVNPGEIGEILIAGPSVTSGYWKQQAQFVDGYLRTGDLGCLDSDGNLFITGRKKEIIIIRGKNYYPHDVEDMAKKSNAIINFSVASAFSVDINDEEKLVLAVEIPTGTKEEIALQIRTDIARKIQDELSLPIHEVVLLRQGQIPRTSSGKIRRIQCKDLYASKGWGFYSDNWQNTKIYAKTRKKVKKTSLLVNFHVNNLMLKNNKIVKVLTGKNSK